MLGTFFNEWQICLVKSFQVLLVAQYTVYMGFICLMMECLDVKCIKSRYIVPVSFCNKGMPCVEDGRLRFEMRCCTQVNLPVGLSSSPLAMLCSSQFKQNLWAALPGFPPWPAWRQCDWTPPGPSYRDSHHWRPVLSQEQASPSTLIHVARASFPCCFQSQCSCPPGGLAPPVSWLPLLKPVALFCFSVSIVGIYLFIYSFILPLPPFLFSCFPLFLFFPSIMLYLPW